MQLSFQEALREARARKNSAGISHIEDLVLTHGFEGAKRAHATLRLLANQLTDITVKIDGSPAILCGPHPLDGRFFIALKHALSTTDLSKAKLARSHAEIDEYYANNHPEARRKLHAAFDALRVVPFADVHFGDILFTKPDKKTVKIGNVPHVIFKPNTIVYAVPFNSPIASRVMLADFGIYWHSSYLWMSTYDDKGSFAPAFRQPGMFVPEPSIFSLQTASSMTSLLNPQTALQLTGDITYIGAMTEKLRGNTFIALLEAAPKVRGFFMRYLNGLIRNGQLQPAQAGPQGFLGFLEGIHKANVARLISSAKKTSAEIQFQYITDAIKGTAEDMLRVLQWQAAVVRLKLDILMWMGGGMGGGRSQHYGTYYAGKNGKFHETGNEGFVVADNQGSYVKLVDRADFSQANMLRIR